MFSHAEVERMCSASRKDAEHIIHEVIPRFADWSENERESVMLPSLEKLLYSFYAIKNSNKPIRLPVSEVEIMLQKSDSILQYILRNNSYSDKHLIGQVLMDIISCVIHFCENSDSSDVADYIASNDSMSNNFHSWIVNCFTKCCIEPDNYILTAH